MKKILLVSLMILLTATPVQAAQPPTISVSLSLVSRDANYMVIHVEWLSGPVQEISIHNANHVFSAGCTFPMTEAGVEEKRITGTGNVTFHVGLRKFKGQWLTPNAWDIAAFQLPQSQYNTITDLQVYDC